MDWIRENKIPAAIIGVSLAGAIGLGVVLYSSYSSYGEKMQQFDSLNRSIQGLKNAPLAPTKENLDAKNVLVTDYAKRVDQLGQVLVRLQKADTPTTNVEFQSKLKNKIAATRQLATERRVSLPATFNLAFDRYIAELPASNEIATELSTYLDGVDELVRLLIDSGVIGLETLERTELKSEGGGDAGAPKAQPKAQPKAKGGAKKGAAGRPAAEAPKMSERWTVKTVLITDQAALQTLMSKLASPSDTQAIPYFPIARLVRIENERQEGPPMAAAPPVLPPEGGAAPAPTEGAAAIAQPAPADSVVILGNERLRVYLEVDFVRFLEAAATPSR